MRVLCCLSFLLAVRAEEDSCTVNNCSDDSSLLQAKTLRPRSEMAIFDDGNTLRDGWGYHARPDSSKAEWGFSDPCGMTKGLSWHIIDADYYNGVNLESPPQDAFNWKAAGGEFEYIVIELYMQPGGLCAGHGKLPDTLKLQLFGRHPIQTMPIPLNRYIRMQSSNLAKGYYVIGMEIPRSQQVPNPHEGTWTGISISSFPVANSEKKGTVDYYIDGVKLTNQMPA